MAFAPLDALRKCTCVFSKSMTKRFTTEVVFRSCNHSADLLPMWVVCGGGSHVCVLVRRCLTKCELTG